MRKPNGGDLVAVAAVAFLAGVLLAWLAPGTLVAGFPLWDAALAGMAVSLLLSVLAFPEWWEWSGGWNAKRPGCERRRHPRHHDVRLIGVRHRTRDLQRRSERGHGRPRHPGRSLLAVDRRAARPGAHTDSRRHRHAPVLRRPHGRSRG